MKRMIMFMCIVYLVFTGCIFNDSPSQVVRKFYDAASKKDLKAMGELATSEMMQMVGMFSDKMVEKLSKNGKITKITEEINGEEATVTVTYKNGETDNWKLIKVKGKWKING